MQNMKYIFKFTEYFASRRFLTVLTIKEQRKPLCSTIFDGEYFQFRDATELQRYFKHIYVSVT